MIFLDYFGGKKLSNHILQKLRETSDWMADFRIKKYLFYRLQCLAFGEKI
jgi:hypothetical protein